MKQKFCPLIKKSYRECYCTSLTSQTIKAAIYYCGEHYLKCRIYKRLSKCDEKKKIYCESLNKD